MASRDNLDKDREWDISFARHLLDVNDYQSFVVAFFAKKNRQWKRPKSLTYTLVQNKCGISRGHLSDVISGRREISLAVFEKLSIAFGLSNPWHDLFYRLICVGNAQFRGPRKSLDQAYADLEKQKRKIRKSLERIWLKEAALEPYKVSLEEHVAEICAVVSSNKDGVSLERISSVTGLSIELLRDKLKRITDVRLLRKDIETALYHSVHEELNIVHQPDSRLFEKYFSNEIKKAIKDDASNPELRLATIQIAVIKKSNIRELCVRLDNLIREFADEIESADGDCVGQILLAFTVNKTQ